MSDNFSGNQVVIYGQVKEQVQLSHVFLGKEYYKTKIRVDRLSGTSDYIPIVTDRNRALILADALRKGENVKIEGELRTRNMREHESADGKRHLMIYVFPRVIGTGNQEEPESTNMVQLEGFICKSPTFRETPLGRKITDICVVVNRQYNNKGSSFYIPCIAWGMDAEQMARLEVGTKIWLKGRIQSRTYSKQISEGVQESRQAYEVSIRPGAYTTLES